MPQPSLSQYLRRLWALEKFGYSLRVLIAMAGSMGLAWYLGQPSLIIPLFLGIIASALAETDDSWLGRLSALLVTLLCFSIAAVAVELLFPIRGCSLPAWRCPPSPWSCSVRSANATARSPRPR